MPYFRLLNNLFSTCPALLLPRAEFHEQEEGKQDNPLGGAAHVMQSLPGHKTHGSGSVLGVCQPQNPENTEACLISDLNGNTKWIWD